MKKQTIMIIALLVIPLAVVAVASNPSAVTVFDGQTVQTMSYYQTVPESTVGWCAPVAALLNYAVFALAVVYGLFKKNWCLKGIFGISFVACCLVVLPIVMQGDIKIVPNVFGAILLIAESLAAYIVMKTPEQTQEKNQPEGKRLNKR